MTKYFKLIRDDGTYWLTPNLTKLLDSLGLLSIDRQLRSTYDDASLKVAFNNNYYSLQRLMVDNDVEVKYGQYNAKGNRVSADTEDVYKTNNCEDLEELSNTQLINLVFKLRKSLQRYTDNLRIERATLRRANRTYDDVLEILPTIINPVKDYSCKELPLKSGKELIIQLSDLHFGEVVDLSVNKFNFEVALRRLEKLFNKAVQVANENKVSKINILFTGDLVNLDSHMDKKLTNESTRTVALVRGFDYLTTCIEFLLKKGFKVSIGSVVGNEGRINANENLSFEDNLASNNFDNLMFNMLKTKFSDSLTYLNEGDKLEDMINVAGKNIIITHGNNITHNKLESEIINMKMRHFQVSNVMADYVLFGHVHSHLVTPFYARSGSLVGVNSYSYNGLNIAGGKASQNLILIGDTIEVTPVILSE